MSSVIVKNVSPLVEATYLYALNELKGRFPEGEQIILNGSAEFACLYAVNVLKTPWPEAEALIMTNIDAVIDYCMKVKGRWPEAEIFIMNFSYSSAMYAIHVIKGRWIEAYMSIRKEERAKLLYLEFLNTLENDNTDKQKIKKLEERADKSEKRIDELVDRIIKLIY